MRPIGQPDADVVEAEGRHLHRVKSGALEAFLRRYMEGKAGGGSPSVPI